jgi:hypothetical protein
MAIVRGLLLPLAGFPVVKVSDFGLARQLQLDGDSYVAEGLGVSANRVNVK